MNFLPIGNSSNPFKGSIQGDGSYIKGINIVSNQTENVGLFGYSEGANFTNINFLDFTVNTTTNSTNVALVFGFLNSSSVSGINLNANNSSLNRIFGNSSMYCGGLFGYVYNSTVNNVTVKNTIVEFPLCQYTGGIFGGIHEAEIISCHNLGFSFKKKKKTEINNYLINKISKIRNF